MSISTGERIFYIVNTIFLIFVSLLCLAPLVHILAISFSANDMVTAGKVTFWPRNFTLIAYEYVMDNKLFWNGMKNSAIRVVLGVGLNLLITLLAAYPLSKSVHRFRERTYYAWFIFLTMVFSGGIIPFYMVVKEVGLLNSMWALVLPGGVNAFYILVLLNFFRGIPSELEDSALIDGSGHWRTLFQIFLPLAKPAIATVSVFAIVGHWNAWFDGLIFMATPDKYPLLTYLQTAIVNINYETLSDEEIKRLALLGQRTNRAAQIFLGSLPVIMCYPFLQKHFTKGLVLGSVKG